METTVKLVPGTIAKVPSGSDPFKVWEIKVGHDGVCYCACPSWRFQKAPAADRKPCKHVRAALRIFARKVERVQAA